MDVFARIDDARREYDVLEHPFYQRWSAGELSAEELGFYAGEYRHAVVALAQTSAAAAVEVGEAHRAGLERHAAEERGHIALWDQFAAAATTTNADAGATTAGAEAEAAAASSSSGSSSSGVAAGDEVSRDEPLSETRQCAQAWTAGEDALEHLAVLYAIEASQPEIAKTKLDGLVERYGYSAEGPAVEYFELHATLDVEHARQARELIEELMGGEESSAVQAERTERMVARARAALQGNWALLDGVQAQFAHAG